MNDVDKIKAEVLGNKGVDWDANLKGWEVNDLIRDVLIDFIEKLDLPDINKCEAEPYIPLVLENIERFVPEDNFLKMSNSYKKLKGIYGY
jgi:hypothetical protein